MNDSSDEPMVLTSEPAESVFADSDRGADASEVGLGSTGGADEGPSPVRDPEADGGAEERSAETLPSDGEVATPGQSDAAGAVDGGSAGGDADTGHGDGSGEPPHVKDRPEGKRLHGAVDKSTW